MIFPSRPAGNCSPSRPQDGVSSAALTPLCRLYHCVQGAPFFHALQAPFSTLGYSLLCSRYRLSLPSVHNLLTARGARLPLVTSSSLFELLAESSSNTSSGSESSQAHSSSIRVGVKLELHHSKLARARLVHSPIAIPIFTFKRLIWIPTNGRDPNQGEFRKCPDQVDMTPGEAAGDPRLPPPTPVPPCHSKPSSVPPKSDRDAAETGGNRYPGFWVCAPWSWLP